MYNQLIGASAPTMDSDGSRRGLKTRIMPHPCVQVHAVFDVCYAPARKLFQCVRVTLSDAPASHITQVDGVAVGEDLAKAKRLILGEIGSSLELQLVRSHRCSSCIAFRVLHFSAGSFLRSLKTCGETGTFLSP